MLRFRFQDRQISGRQVSVAGNARPGAVGLRPAVLLPVFGAAIALGGCSADFLRFDSPVFGLNGDKRAVEERVADTSSDPTLYGQRTASAPVSSGGGTDDYASAPVSGVSRSASSTPAKTYQNKPERVARAAPIVETPSASRSDTTRSTYAPLTTGALPAGDRVVVRSGDTLYQLSRRHGVSVAALRQANGLTGNVIRPGQTLVVPRDNASARQVAAAPARQTAPRYNTPNTQYRRPAARAAARSAQPSAGGTGTGGYTVRPGDSLYAISRRTGVSVAELKRINGITNVRALRPGMQLSLGGGAPATKVASRSTIQAKTIRTMPIVRSPGASAGTSTSTTSPAAGSAYQPQILNKRPSKPIATKPPKQEVAMSPPAAAAQNFRWPARGRVIAPFNHSGKGTKNDGINIALPLGTDIAAADSGVVAYAGSELKGYGNLVLVRHDNGWVSAYAHASQLLVKRGDRVTRGQTIAKAGRSGGVTQPQLHFELRKGAKPVDPMPHLEQSS